MTHDGHCDGSDDDVTTDVRIVLLVVVQRLGFLESPDGSLVRGFSVEGQLEFRVRTTSSCTSVAFHHGRLCGAHSRVIGSCHLADGAGDQNIMFWYVEMESDDAMPLTHSMATCLEKYHCEPLYYILNSQNYFSVMDSVM